MEKWKKNQKFTKVKVSSRTPLHNSKSSLKQKLRSRWRILKKTVCIAYELLEQIFMNLKLGPRNIFFKPKRKLTSKRSKWKKVGNSLHFITLRKNCANAAKFCKIDGTVIDKMSETWNTKLCFYVWFVNI